MQFTLVFVPLVSCLLATAAAAASSEDWACESVDQNRVGVDNRIYEYNKQGAVFEESSITAHYRFGKCLGEGSFGLVVKGRSKDEKRQWCAIKCFAVDKRDHFQKEKILREIKIMQFLKDCPFVVKIVGAYRHPSKLKVVKHKKQRWPG